MVLSSCHWTPPPISHGKYGQWSETTGGSVSEARKWVVRGKKSDVTSTIKHENENEKRARKTFLWGGVCVHGRVLGGAD